MQKLLTLFSIGRDSLQKSAMNKMFIEVRKMARYAGYTKTEESTNNLENIAPALGPIMKPKEKAIPTKAYS